MFSTSNPAEIMNKLKSYRSIKIFTSDRPASICAAKIITLLLHKELVKFEMGFPSEDERYDSDVDFYVFIGLNPGDCRNFFVFDNKQTSSVENSLFTCICSMDELYPCVLSYSLAKSMNYVNSDVLWPMIACFDFYRIFTKEDLVFNEENKENEDSEESGEEYSLDNICKGCKSLYLDLVFEVRKESNFMEVDGIYYKKRPRLSFLNFASLFSALQNDISFILERKLYHKKNRKAGDQSIYEYLARKGISQRSSQEAYMNLGYQTKKLVGSQFRQAKSFCKKIGHNTEISPIENFFLICYHLLKGSMVDAFLSISNKGLVEMDKSIRFYKKLVGIYRDCIASPRKLGDILFFRIKSPGILKDVRVGLLLHLYSYHFKTFIRRKYDNKYSQVIILEEHLEDKLIVASNDPGIMFELSEFGEHLDGYIAVEKVEFSRFIERLGARI